MSDDDNVRGVRTEESDGGALVEWEGDDSDEDNFVPPCFGISFGMFCLVVSVCGLFWNEGRFAQRMEGLSRASRVYVVPCDDGCAKCDMNQVKEVNSDKRRPLKKGDLVYMACNLHDLENVSILGHGFKPSELAGLVKAEAWADKAGLFAWKFEMLQQGYEAWRGEVKGTSSSDLAQQCHKLARANCDESRRIGNWSKGGRGSRTECAGLPREQCLQNEANCEWSWSCPKVQNEAQCRALEPSGECQWAGDNPVTVKDEECMGCCPTDDTWRFACRPKQSFEAASRRLQRQWQAEEAEHRRQGWGLPAAPRELSERKKTIGACKVKMCTFTTAWSSQMKRKPPAWKKLPLTSGNLQYAEQPAYNLKELSSGTHSAARKVRFGANRGQTESVSIFKLHAKVFPEQSLVPVHLKPHTATTTLRSKKESTQYTLNEAQAETRITVTKLDRSDPSCAWNVSNSNVGVNHCQAGCICSASESGSEAGDLRVCIARSNIVRLSLIAKVEKDARGGWTLVEDKSLGGVLMRLNQRVPATDLMNEAQTAVTRELQILRWSFPIVMWIGFYCCLSPILWVIDTCGSAFECIPCLGGLLGGLASCVETLVECAICMVSCCSALSCSLLIASFAWVWYRPRSGLQLLGAAILLFVILGGFALSRRGMSRVRRKNRSAREPQVNVEMPTVGAPAVPQLAQFVVICPAGLSEERLVQVQAPDGRLVQVQVPEGVVEGQQFVVQVS